MSSLSRLLRRVLAGALQYRMVTNDKTGRATSQITVTIRLYPLPFQALAEGRIEL
jgi:hypothetical protein